MLVNIAEAEIDVDPEATKACYSELPVGVSCNCAPCRNFITLKETAFPQTALQLFQRIGVDHRKPKEVYHNAKLANGLHSYGGWFHFVGKIISDVAAPHVPGKMQTMEYQSVGQNFRLYCTNRVALVSKSFGGRPVVQLEFFADLPWVLKEAEPN